MQGYLRGYLAEKAGAEQGDFVLDLCTGTGSVALVLADYVGTNGLVVGLDFSQGMLAKAQEKVRKRELKNINWVQAEAGELPFKDNSFASTTCSHAFYELKSSQREGVLGEIVRVTRPGGRFCMMEHEVPKNFIIRILFYIRMYAAGAKEVRSFLKEEIILFERFFKHVQKEIVSTGRSKVIYGEVAKEVIINA